MTALNRAWPFLAALIAILCLPHSATAAKASKIVLQDSTVYENVVYVLDNAYKVITISQGALKKTISYADVVAIYDDHGEDVTEDELGSVHARATGKSAPSAPTPLESEGAKLSAPSATQPAPGTGLGTATTAELKRQPYPWKFAIRTAGNFSVPASDYYDGLRSGIGFEGDLIFPVARRLALRLSVSRSGIRDDPERLIELTYPGYQLVSDNQTVTMMRYVAAFEYYDWPHWRTGGLWKYYLYTGLGAVNHSISGTLTIRDPGSGSLYELVPSGRDLTRFMWNLGGGATVKIGKHIGLDGSGEFDFVVIGSNSDSYSAYDAVEYAYIFDVKLGIVWLF